MKLINYKLFWTIILTFFFNSVYSQVPLMVIAGGQQIFKSGVCEVSKKTMPWLKIQFSGGAVSLSNGNTILCNADWHIKDHEAQEYQLLEITKDYKLVWAITKPTISD